MEEGSEKDDARIWSFFHHPELRGARRPLEIDETMAYKGIPAVGRLGKMAEGAEENGVDEE